MSGELWTAFATVIVIWAVTVVSPGPNFLITAQSSARYGRQSGLLVSAGIGVGTLIWAGGSLAGLALLFQTAGWLYAAVKLVGGLYLVGVGLLMLRSALRSPVSTTTQAVAAPSRNHAFRMGLLTDLANPKAAAFFASLFAVAVPPSAPLAAQLAIVLTVTAMAWGWYSLVAVAMTTGPILVRYQRAERWITGIAGVAFMAMGAKLASDR